MSTSRPYGSCAEFLPWSFGQDSGHFKQRSSTLGRCILNLDSCSCHQRSPATPPASRLIHQNIPLWPFFSASCLLDVDDRYHVRIFYCPSCPVGGTQPSPFTFRQTSTLKTLHAAFFSFLTVDTRQGTYHNCHIINTLPPPPRVPIHLRISAVQPLLGIGSSLCIASIVITSYKFAILLLSDEFIFSLRRGHVCRPCSRTFRPTTKYVPL